MKIVTIIGARPQFVKHATFQKYLNENSTFLENVCIHTGQHFDANMTTDICSNFEIDNPILNLNINANSNTSNLTMMISSLADAFSRIKPAYVLVYGDTNSTLAGALAANLAGIPIIHVEAGLRSFDMRMPEERNRILTDRLSTHLIVPDDNASSNLKVEGFPHNAYSFGENRKQKIHNFGDIMYDSFLALSPKFKNIEVHRQDYVLATIHREQLFNDPIYLGDIVNILKALAQVEHVVLPAHPRIYKDDNMRKMLESHGVEVIPPLSYLKMQAYIANSKFIVTDSGGLQKEAHFHKKYCITLRENTEWTATLSNGCNQLIGSSVNKFHDSLKFIQNRISKIDFSVFGNPYGDGSFCRQLEGLFLKG